MMSTRKITFEEFVTTLSNAEAPAKLSPVLRALWYAGKDDWEAAHNIAQDIHTPDGSWIHAYLHRLEGDDGNASYWYYKAGTSMPNISLKEEWKALVLHFLDK